MNPRVIQLIGRYLALFSAAAGGGLIIAGNWLALAAGLLVAIGTAIDHYLHPVPAPSIRPGPGMTVRFDGHDWKLVDAAPPAPLGESACGQPIMAPTMNVSPSTCQGRLTPKGHIDLRLVAGLAVLFGAIVGLTFCPGCSGSYGVSGATAVADLTRTDGTKFHFESNKDTSADSIAFDPATGQLNITKLNTVGSALAPYQAAFSINQTNQVAAVVLAVVDALAKAGLALTQNPLTGQLQVVAIKPAPPPPGPGPATQPAMFIIQAEPYVLDLRPLQESHP